MFKVTKALIGVMFLLLCNLIFSEEPKPTSFFRLKFQDLTNSTLVFKISFDFAIPEGYVVTSDTTDSNINVVLHKTDLVRVNQNGGIIEPKTFEFPFYAVQASRRFGFLKSEKFSVEKGAQDFGQDYTFKYDMKRIDESQMPVLTMESKEPDGQKVRFLLISPNYGTWVFDLQFFDSPKHAEFSALFWQKIITILKGQDASAPNISASRRLIEPQFPDSDKFFKDIYRLSYNLWKPMSFPNKLPDIGKTTEKELNAILPEDAIKDRLTFLSPISWKKGGKDFVFDKFIDYEIVQDYKKDENSKLESYSRVGFWEFQVFLRKGVVVGYNMLHMSTGPSGQYEPDSKSLTKTPIVGDKRALESAYLEQRHPLFRKAHKK